MDIWSSHEDGGRSVYINTHATALIFPVVQRRRLHHLLPHTSTLIHAYMHTRTHTHTHRARSSLGTASRSGSRSSPIGRRGTCMGLTRPLWASGWRLTPSRTLSTVCACVWVCVFCEGGGHRYAMSSHRDDTCAHPHIVSASLPTIHPPILHYKKARGTGTWPSLSTTGRRPRSRSWAGSTGGALRFCGLCFFRGWGSLRLRGRDGLSHTLPLHLSPHTTLPFPFLSNRLPFESKNSNTQPLHHSNTCTNSDASLRYHGERADFSVHNSSRAKVTFEVPIFVSSLDRDASYMLVLAFSS